MLDREHPAQAQERPARARSGGAACACTAAVPCALHYAKLPQQTRLEVRARVHVAEGWRSSDRPRPSRRPTRPPLDAPCACDGDRPCLAHYETLDSRSQARARQRAGIPTPEWRSR